MSKPSKKYSEARKHVEAKEYGLDEAVDLIKKISFARFDESLDIAVLRGVDPKHADQMVRGTVVLPHGTGKTKRVLVVASGEKIKEAEEARSNCRFPPGKRRLLLRWVRLWASRESTSWTSARPSMPGPRVRTE